MHLGINGRTLFKNNVSMLILKIGKTHIVFRITVPQNSN